MVYCWGDNAYGQCGVPSNVFGEILKPRPVMLPTGIHPSQIVCGANFTVLITNVGQLYTWGCGLSGQLGHGEASRKNM